MLEQQALIQLQAQKAHQAICEISSNGGRHRIVSASTGETN